MTKKTDSSDAMPMAPRSALIVSLGIIVVIVLLSLPLHYGWAFDQKLFRFADYAIWVQSILTIYIVAIAWLTLSQQKNSLDVTLAQQQQANSNLLLGILLDNLNKLEGHINYLTAAAYFEQRRNRNIIEADGKLDYVQNVISDKIILPSGPLRDSLLEEFEKVISFAEAGNALSFLDHRIVQLHAKLSDQMKLEK